MIESSLWALALPFCASGRSEVAKPRSSEMIPLNEPNSFVGLMCLRVASNSYTMNSESVLLDTIGVCTMLYEELKRIARAVDSQMYMESKPLLRCPK